MADFYEEMLAMVDDLLAPTSADGLGQGTIELVHVKNVSDPSQPWLPPVESVTSEVIRGAARGVSQNLVGTSIGDTVIQGGDLEVIATVPKEPYQTGDRLRIDGVSMTILSFSKIPAAGITSAVKFIVRT